MTGPRLNFRGHSALRGPSNRMTNESPLQLHRREVDLKVKSQPLLVKFNIEATVVAAVAISSGEFE